jgi:lipopolysaccharide export system ATP-binding protein
MNALLVADSISKSFGANKVLTSATLRAVPGELRALVGRNGAGKTTLIRIAAGWSAPDGGAVHYAGSCYLSANLSKLAREGLFYLPDRDLLSGAFTLRQQLEMFRTQFKGSDPHEAAARMGVDMLLDRRTSALSGGEKRRAELAAILVRRPACLLADEPYRGIAPRDAEDITAAFLSLTADGCAVVVTGHEVPALLAAANQVTWCTAGTTYELGSPSDALRHHEFRRQYLGPKHYASAQKLRSRSVDPETL